MIEPVSTPPVGALFGWNASAGKYAPVNVDSSGIMGLTFASSPAAGTPAGNTGQLFGSPPANTLYGWNAANQSYYPLALDNTGNLVVSSTSSSDTFSAITLTGNQAAGNLVGATVQATGAANAASLAALLAPVASSLTNGFSIGSF